MTTPTITLPATRVPAPTREWAVTDVNHFQGRDGYGLSGDLTRNGITVGTIHDEGVGGGIRPQMHDRSAREDFEALVKTWPGECDLGHGLVVPYDSELVLEALVTEYGLRKDLRKNMKKGLVMAPHDDPEAIVVQQIGSRTTAKGVRAEIVTRGDQLAGYDVWDGTDWVPVPAAAA